MGKKKSSVEILNDFDNGLMNFWSVVKNAHDQLIESFKYTLVSRETFDDYKKDGKRNIDVLDYILMLDLLT